MKRICEAIYLFVLCTYAIGCKSSENHESYEATEIAVDVDCPGAAAAYMVDSVSFLPLQLTSDESFSTISKIAVRDTLIYILDRRLAKVCVFGLDGRWRFSINRRGRGPGEYLEVQSCSVDKNHVYVIDNLNGKIMVYNSRNGAFEYSLDIPDQFSDIESLDDGGFLIAYSPGIGSVPRAKALNYRIIHTDNKLSIVESFFGFRAKGDVDILSYYHYLARSGNNIVFCSFHEDAYYVFDSGDGSLKNRVSIKFSNPLTKEERGDFDALNNSRHAFLCDTPFEVNGITYARVHVNEGEVPVLVDTETGDTILNNRIGDNYLYNVVGCHDTGFIGVIDDGMIYDSLVQNGFPHAGRAAEDAVHNDMPVLIFYHIKQR